MPEISRHFIATYADTVFADAPPGTAIALRGLPENNGSTRPYLIWLDACVNASVRNRAILSFVQYCTLNNLAAFCVPGFVVGNRAGNADVQSIRCLVLDIDSGDIAAKAERATQVLGTPSLAVWSGGEINGQRKTHLYWRLSGDISRDFVTRLWGMAAQAFGGDSSFSFGRAHQPIRIAGSLHRKAAPTLVSIAYGSAAWLDSGDVLRRLEGIALNQTADLGLQSGGTGDDSNMLGLARQVSMDELPARFIGHGESDITRFEALTRMAGMVLANIGDVGLPLECEREYQHFREWCVSHIENVERDYDLRGHWNRLLARERWKRQQPRRPRARRWAR